MHYQVALIGCGDMGRAHAKAYSERPDTTLATVFDLIPERAQAMADTYGAKVCSSAEEALSQPGLSLASICIPVCDHPAMSILGLQHGLHVLCEKPIALTDEAAAGMIAQAEACDRLLAVSYQYRSLPANQRYRELIRSGALGSPIFARFVDVREVRPKLAMHRRSMNGGPLIDMAGHYFDLMTFLTGEEPLHVSARGHVYGKGKPRLAEVTDHAIDAAEVLVEYGGGHTLSAFVNWGMPERHPGFGDTYINGPLAVTRQAGNEVILTSQDTTTHYRLPDAPGGPAARIADLIGAIQGESQLEVDAAAGRRALSVSLAALRSIESGKTEPVVIGCPTR